MNGRRKRASVEAPRAPQSRPGGLEMALLNGLLGSGSDAVALFRVGRAYQQAFEQAHGQCGLVRSIVSRSVRSSYRPNAPLGAISAVLSLEEMVGVRNLQEKNARALTQRELDACALICGLDMTVNAAATALRADRKALAVALRRALRQIATNKGWVNRSSVQTGQISFGSFEADLARNEPARAAA